MRCASPGAILCLASRATQLGSSLQPKVQFTSGTKTLATLHPAVRAAATAAGHFLAHRQLLLLLPPPLASILVPPLQAMFLPTGGMRLWSVMISFMIPRLKALWFYLELCLGGSGVRFVIACECRTVNAGRQGCPLRQWM